MTSAAADEAQLLRRDGEDEVVLRRRQVQRARLPALAQGRCRTGRPSPARAGPGRCGSRCPADRAKGSRNVVHACHLVGAAARRRRERRRCRPARAAASCHRLPPATKNIVNAVSVRTPVVPRSGSRSTSASERARRSAGTAAGRSKSDADPRAARGQPVREVDDERELGELGRVHARQRTDLQPARRAADLDRLDRPDRRQQDEHQQDQRDDEGRHRDQAQVAVVERASKTISDDRAAAPPRDACGPTHGERVV